MSINNREDALLAYVLTVSPDIIAQRIGEMLDNLTEIQSEEAFDNIKNDYKSAFNNRISENQSRQTDLVGRRDDIDEITVRSARGGVKT